MIIGLFAVSGNKHVGGGYVYQKSLLDEILSRQVSNTLEHKVILFYRGEPDFINDQTGCCVNIEWYNGRLNEAAMRHHVDIIWFLSAAYEEVDMPHILPVWDLQHRLQTYFPEVSSGGIYVSRENNNNQFLPRATFILTGTEEGKKEISFFYRIPPDRIIVNPLPSPQYISKVPTEKTDELKNLGLTKNGFIFYPAQFWPHKNHIVLLETIKILKAQHNSALKVVFTGSDCGNRGYVVQMISKMGLEDDVVLLGFVSTESILWLYQNACALVYPSYFGPDNIPPIEAFSAGCPVIAANVSGTEEQLGDAAILIDPQDEAGFANAILKLIQEPLSRDMLIQKGSDRAEARTAERYVQNVLDEIDKFASVRRCWGSHFTIKYTPKLMDWLKDYLYRKEIHSFITLLSLCPDQSFDETFSNIASVYQNIVDANKSAEAEITAKNHNRAFEILDNILKKCTDYAPAYLNMAKIYYSRSEIDKAFECTKKAGFYDRKFKSIFLGS